MAKRKQARVMVHRRVEYQHARGQGEGTLVDLSLQGCRIQGAPPFPCGTRLRLQLWLPDQAQPVKVELAAVRWIAAEQFGVSFLDMSPDARGHLERGVQVLHEAQQLPVKALAIAACLAPGQAAAGHEIQLGVGKPTDDHAGARILKTWEA